MSEFDRYLKLDLTTQELIDWDIPCNAEGVFARFSISYEKFKGDEEFFLTVFSKAAADWVKKKKKGTKLDSLSKHFSTYLKKDMKKREDLKKNTGEIRTGAAEPEISKPENIDDIPEGPGFDDLDMDTGTKEQEPEEREEKNSVYEDPESDPFPVEESEKVFPVSSPVTTHQPMQSSVLAGDSPQPEVTHDSPPTLSILDEEDFEEPDIVDSEKSETETFEKHKRKRSGLMTGFIIMFILLIGTGIAMTVLSKMFEVEKPVEEKPIEDYSEMKKGQIQGSLTKAMNEKDNTELKEQKVSEEEPRETVQNSSHTAVTHGNSSSSGGNYGSNAKKDEEILNQYASEVDPASGGAISSGNPRGGRRYFTPGGGGTQGGVFIKGSENSSSGKKSLDMHNIKLKVRLEFSIRSTAASTVIAVVTEDSDKIPKGAKFYGSATGYVNKRTQLSFSKLLMNGEEYTVKGFGISGKDPGIESEVTDISKDNIDSSIKQGVVQTLANVANKYAGGAGEVAGDAASNTVDPAAGEIQKQQEANKMTQEYRVPAGTSFFIYLE